MRGILAPNNDFFLRVLSLTGMEETFIKIDKKKPYRDLGIQTGAILYNAQIGSKQRS